MSELCAYFSLFKNHSHVVKYKGYYCTLFPNREVKERTFMGFLSKKVINLNFQSVYTTYFTNFPPNFFFPYFEFISAILNQNCTLQF